MTENLFQIFDLHSEAVVIAEREKVVYFNPAAKTLFGHKIENSDLSGLFPARFLANNDNSFTDTFYLGEASYKVTAARDDRHTVYSIFGGAPGVEESTANIIAGIGSAMRDMLGVLNAASRNLTPAIESIDDKKLNYSLAAVQHTYHSLHRLSDNMKIFFDLYNCTNELKVQTFDIVELCKEMVDFISYSLHSRNLDIQLNCEKNRILYKGDGNKIAKMILNLLSNSIKYTPNGGKISITIKEKRTGITLAVKDNGSGIPADVVSNAFNSYVLPKKFSDPVRGVGLGLAVVQHVARLHGGTAVLETSASKGTTVTVTLPRSKDFALADHDSEIGMNYLTNLSDVLPTEAYFSKYLD